MTMVMRKGRMVTVVRVVTVDVAIMVMPGNELRTPGATWVCNIAGKGVKRE